MALEISKMLQGMVIFCEKCVEIYIHDEVMAVEISKVLQGMVLFIDGQSHHEVMALEMSKVLQGMGDLYTDECHHETFHHGRFPFLSGSRSRACAEAGGRRRCGGRAAAALPRPRVRSRFSRNSPKISELRRAGDSLKRAGGDASGGRAPAAQAGGRRR